MRRPECSAASRVAIALGVWAGLTVLASGQATVEAGAPYAVLDQFVRWDAESVRAVGAPDPETAGYRAVVVTDSADVCEIALEPLGTLLSALTPEEAARRVRVSGDADPDGRFEQPFLNRAEHAPTRPDGSPYPPYWRAPSPAWVQLDLPQRVRLTRIEVVPPADAAPPRMVRVEGASATGPLFAIPFRSVLKVGRAGVEAIPELEPTRAVRVSLEAEASDADSVAVQSLRIYGVRADEVCAADVVVHGLARFALEAGTTFAVAQDGRPARWSEAVADGRALRIAGVRWSGGSTLRIRRSDSGLSEGACVSGDAVPLVNAGFEQWEAGGPVGWTAREGHGRFLRADEALATEGAHALRTGGVYYYLFVRQTATLPGNAAGKLVVLSAKVRAFEPDSVYVSLDPPEYGEIFSARHPGDGRAQTLRASCRIPPFSRDGEVVVTLGHSGIPKRPAYFDDVRLTVR